MQHEFDWQVLNSVLIKDEKWENTSGYNVRMNEIIINLQHVDQRVMTCPGRNHRHEAAGLIDPNVIKLSLL